MTRQFISPIQWLLRPVIFFFQTVKEQLFKIF